MRKNQERIEKQPGEEPQNLRSKQPRKGPQNLRGKQPRRGPQNHLEVGISARGACTEKKRGGTLCGEGATEKEEVACPAEKV